MRDLLRGMTELRGSDAVYALLETFPRDAWDLIHEAIFDAIEGGLTELFAKTTDGQWHRIVAKRSYQSYDNQIDGLDFYHEAVEVRPEPPCAVVTRRERAAFMASAN